MPGWVRVVERVSDRAGSVASWLLLAMLLLGAYNAIARYVGRHVGLSLSSNAYIELQWYLFSLVFLLGAAYAARHDAHVRVDVLFAQLSPRRRGWVDILGTILFLVPFCVFVIVTSWPSVRNSWAVWEASPDPGGLPRYPLKTMVPIAFALLILQGLATLRRRWETVRAPTRADS